MAIPGTAVGEALQGAMSSGLTSAGSSLSSGLLGQLFAGMNARRQWRYQKKQMALQQQYALEQMQKQFEYQQQQFDYTFDKQNEYNDPTAVFARFRAAGANPSAVLGQSGAQMGVTLGGQTGTSTPASGPGGGFNMPTPAAYASGLTAAQLQNIRSQTSLNESQAAKNRSETHTEDYMRRRDEIDLAIGDFSRESAEQQVKILKAKAVILDSDAYLARITIGYKFEEVQAQLQLLKDQADIFREQKPMLSRMAGASYLATLASAYYYSSAGDLAQTNVDLTEVAITDARRQFELDWDKKVTVNEYDAKGNVIGTREMTYKEMYVYITSHEAEASDFLVPQARYDVRRSKNSLGYGIVQALAAGLVGAAASIGGAAIASRVVKKPSIVTSNPPYTPRIDAHGSK
uniref:DNA pilot protein n=1 Tax=Dulem virus 212 TaxID=3145689 RepID=A0AAU8B946_9VIRU